jgi:hypothetical protein
MTVPALSQSTEETMSCPTSYAVQSIKGSKSPGGMQSARGLEVHHVSSLYINHCATRKVPADWARFDELALGSGAEAADILTGIRDNYVVDFEHVYDTELWLAVDNNWKAVEVPLAVRSMTREAREAWAAANGVIYHGTLDGLYFLSQARAKIEDFKSHPRPFEANTIQSKRYALLVLLNFPEVEEVTFELIFVRYANCRRSVTYTREDLPWMRQQVINARARQIRLHERYDAGETLEAYPGAHCTYCPLLKSFNGCPIAEFNEYATHTLEERARFAIWVEQVNKVNKQVLKDAVNASGKNIELRDGNGRLVQFGFNARESTQFPLLLVDAAVPVRAPPRTWVTSSGSATWSFLRPS